MVLPPHALATARDGTAVKPTDPAAVAWDVIGALTKAQHEHLAPNRLESLRIGLHMPGLLDLFDDDAGELIKRHRGYYWGDDDLTLWLELRRTQDDAVALLHRAIAREGEAVAGPIARRGLMLYEHIPNWPEHRLYPLDEKFAHMLMKQRAYREIFGVI